MRTYVRYVMYGTSLPGPVNLKRRWKKASEKSKRETHADASNRCDAIECDVAIKTFQRLRHRFGKFAGVEVSSQFTYPIGPVHLNWI